MLGWSEGNFSFLKLLTSEEKSLNRSLLKVTLGRLTTPRCLLVFTRGVHGSSFLFYWNVKNSPFHSYGGKRTSETYFNPWTDLETMSDCKRMIQLQLKGPISSYGEFVGKNNWLHSRHSLDSKIRNAKYCDCTSHQPNFNFWSKIKDKMQWRTFWKGYFHSKFLNNWTINSKRW